MPVRMRKGKTYSGPIGTFREGQTVTDEDLAEDLLELGYAEEFITPSDPADDDEAPESEPPAERPNKTDNKPVWVAWAVEHHGLDPAEAGGLTKKKLMALPDPTGD